MKGLFCLNEIYREESQVSDRRMQISYGGLAVIVLLWIYEGYRYVNTGYFSPLGWGFNILFLLMWIWRVVFKYTYILRDGEMEVISHGVGIRRSFKVDLTKTESYTNKYIKSFFKKTKIRHYIHRYSSVDPNEQRLLVFTEGKENKRLAGIIFKCSEKFLRELRKQMPDKFLNLN